MNGAESLIRTLVKAGVDVCFANPGTSEMHLVQAIDGVPEMRAVLALFEGVCTGAADGYARMKGVPATTLLHLGPGLGNGIANLHNARRASTPLINLIGNHAAYHLGYDAPLTSDIDTLACNVSSWIKSDSSAASLAQDAADAVAASLTPTPGSKGQIATMIIPAEAAWGEAGSLGEIKDIPVRNQVEDAAITQAIEACDKESMILLNGPGLTQAGLKAAGRIAKATECRVSLTTFPGRVDGGAGRPVLDRLPYFPEQVLASLSTVKKLILAGAEAPVSFFAYPETPSYLVPDGCEVLKLAGIEDDVVGALEAVADSLNAGADDYAVNQYDLPEIPSGKLSARSAAAVIANLIPEDTIICGDSGGGGAAFGPTQTGKPHTWLNLTGGSIGQGGPAAVGAAVACPGRKVLALLGDGAAMYTNQALWSQAREGLDVTTVVFANRSYGILDIEYRRLGVNEVGERAASLFDLSNPDLDFVALGASMGVAGSSARTVEEFSDALARGLSTPGPYLIEAIV